MDPLTTSPSDETQLQAEPAPEAAAAPPSPAPAPAAEPESDAPPPAATGKKPVNATKRERDRIGARLRRQAQKAEKAKGEAELEAAVAEGQAPTKAGKSKALAKPVEPLEKGQLPGWPKPSEVEAIVPLACHLWGEAQKHLVGTRYAQCLEKSERPVLNPEDPTKPPTIIEVDPVAMLGKSSAPLLCQLLGKVSSVSPAAAFLVGVAGVFGPTAAQHGYELVLGLFKK